MELAKTAGLLINTQQKQLTLWNGDTYLPDLIWQVSINVPFSYAASRNHMYTMRRQGRMALCRKAYALRDEITRRLRGALIGRRVAHNKLWIDILVEKPNHRGDAINVIDLVCNAIKGAVPVDDRWFCLRCVDWVVVKKDPQMHIKVGQTTDQDCQVCSYCGHIRPFEDFTKQRQARLGIGWVCRICRRYGRELGRASRDNSNGD